MGVLMIVMYSSKVSCLSNKIWSFQLPPEKEMEPEKKIARLAIGVEGGFNPDANKKRYEYEEFNSVVVLPNFDVIPLPNPDLPELVCIQI